MWYKYINEGGSSYLRNSSVRRTACPICSHTEAFYSTFLVVFPCTPSCYQVLSDAIDKANEVLYAQRLAEKEKEDMKHLQIYRNE